MATSNVALAAYKAGERAKRKGKSRRAKFNISLAVVAGTLPYLSTVKDGFDAQGLNGAMKMATKAVGYDGYSKTWSFTWVKQSGIMGVLAGVLVHKMANRFGVNTYVRKISGGLVSI